MDFIKQFFAKKTVMFYVGLAGALLSVIGAFVYLGAYSGTRYFGGAAFAFALIAGLLYIALSVLSLTSGFAAPVMAAFGLASFCCYLDTTYMYFSEVFYHGITAESLAMLNPNYVFCFIVFFATFVIGTVGFFISQEKRTATGQAQASAKRA